MRRLSDAFQQVGYLRKKLCVFEEIRERLLPLISERWSNFSTPGKCRRVATRHALRRPDYLIDNEIKAASNTVGRQHLPNPP